MLAAQCDGNAVATVEGLAQDGALNALQQAFWDRHGLQCGFCTPGRLMTLTELLADVPDPTEAQVREALSGHLCRCTGYQNIVAAALEAAKARGPGTPPAPAPTPPRAEGRGEIREVGRRARRIEDPALLRGAGRFVDDLPVAGVLHAAFVRSPHAHARIVSVDCVPARALAGVAAVYAAADIAPGLTRLRMPLGFPVKGLPDRITPFVLAPERRGGGRGRVRTPARAGRLP
jgi:hypothetical protein